MTATNATRDMFLWLDQVQADPAVPPSAFELAYIISTYINSKSGKAWPEQPTLAARLGMSVRTVRELTNILVAAGHIDVTRGRGRRRSSVYQLAIKEDENRNHSSAFDDGKEEPQFRSHTSKTGTTVPKNRNYSSAPEQLKNHHSRPERRECGGSRASRPPDGGARARHRKASQPRRQSHLETAMQIALGGADE